MPYATTGTYRMKDDDDDDDELIFYFTKPGFIKPLDYYQCQKITNVKK